MSNSKQEMPKAQYKSNENLLRQHAVNNHNRLLAALKDCVDLLRNNRLSDLASVKEAKEAIKQAEK
jgi:hypothetical protein